MLGARPWGGGQGLARSTQICEVFPASGTQVPGYNDPPVVGTLINQARYCKNVDLVESS